MKKIKFANLDTDSLVRSLLKKVVARNKSKSEPQHESQPEPVAPPVPGNPKKAEKQPKFRARRMVFSTGRFLAAPTRVKEIKIKFILKK
jgi:hypothetical protein